MKVDHIGLATNTVEDGLALWRDVLGLEVDTTEEIAEQGVRVAMLAIGDTHVELLEPLSPESPVAKFISKRGPGIHHIAVEVKDIRASLAEFKQRGARLKYAPKVFAYRFTAAISSVVPGLSEITTFL